MRYAALSAVVFGGALFLAPNSPSQQISLADSGNIKNKIGVSAPLVSSNEPSNSKKPEVRPASPQLPVIEPRPVMVTVAPGDSLIKIAKAVDTPYQRVYDANPVIADPNAIVPGQELRIPTADEVLAQRELPKPVLAPAPVATKPLAAAAYRGQTPATPAAPAVAGGSVWDRLAACESGGRWSVNTGNGYYGGLQFSLASWRGVGGVGMPHEASREEQILRGEILQQRGGWGNWPACTAKLGIR